MLRHSVAQVVSKSQRLINSSIPLQHAALVRRPTRVKEDFTEVPNTFLDRTLLTLDVSLSKLFPGGFGWQAASVLAANSGLKSTDLLFAVSTGVGDLCGVALGHIIASYVKAAFTGNSVRNEVPVATWLGAAAFCSGTLWQPSVNFFAGLGLHFPAVFACVGLVCGAAFFVGLRLGRYALKNLGIAAPTSHNLREDAGLSVAIGGAASMFVSTDISIPKNSLDSIFGVTAEMTAFEGCLRAGASTATGFAILHTVQNTRAAESGAYLTRETFLDVSTAVAEEIVRSNPATKTAIQNFLDEHAEEVFDRFDVNADGRVTHDELHEQSIVLQDYMKRMKAASMTMTEEP